MANTTNYDLNLFLKKNKKPKENLKFAATKDLTDKDGNPVIWEFRKITSREFDTINQKHVSIKKKDVTVNQQAIGMEIITTSCITPNLNDVTLQEAYGVIGAENLFYEMISDPAEYRKAKTKILTFNGYYEGDDIEDEIKEAKN